MTTYQLLALADVIPHPGNVRKDLGDLTASIKAQGVLQPIVVAPDTLDGTPTGRHVLIAGHRRHAAAQQAGIDTIPAVIRDDLDTAAKVLTAMLAENLARRDLTLMEEADAYHQLELLGVKDTAIAKAVGRTPRTVKDRRLIACLPAHRRDQLQDGRLTLDAAIKCARLRAKHHDDPEILQRIDDAGCWKFTGAWGIDQEIKGILTARTRATEPEPDSDDPDTADDATALPVPGQTTIEQQIRAQQLAAERDTIPAAWARHHEYLRTLLRPGALALETIDALAEELFTDLLEHSEVDEDVLALLGIDVAYDEDTAKYDGSWGSGQALLYLVLAGSDFATTANPGPWQLTYAEITRRATALTALGYQPTPDEQPTPTDTEDPS